MFVFLRNSFLLTLCALCGIAGRADAATLHALLVADTHDGSIGESVAKDIDLMTSEAQQIASLTDMDLSLRVLIGSRCSSDRVWTEVTGLECEEDDVLLFFYSGHGYRTQDKDTEWPVLFFGWYHKGLDLHSIARQFQSKGARLSIVLADCCNSFSYSGPDFKAKQVVSEELARQRYAELFLGTEGALIVSSSSIGEYSYAMDDGGMFTLAFLDELRTATGSTEVAEWSHLLNGVYNQTSYAQHPQYAWLD